MNLALLQNSLLVAAASAAAAAFLGAVFAIAVAGSSVRIRRIGVAVAVIALVLPPFLVTNTWLKYFGLAGVWRQYLDFNLYSLGGTVWLITLSLWPVPFFFLLGSLLRVQPVYLEQEPFLRGGALFRYLLWPACRVAFWQGLALSFVLALNNFSIPVLLQTKVYTEEVWLTFSTRFDFVAALKVSWPLVLGPLVLLWLARFRATRFVFRTREFPEALLRERMGSIYPVALTAASLIALGTIALPSWQLLANRRTWTEFLPAIAAGQSAAWNSLWFASASAILVMICGVILRRKSWPFWTWMLFLTPGVVIGIGLIWLLNRPPLIAFYQSAGIVLFAYLLRHLAIGWSSARLGWAGTDRSLSEVVSLAGGNWRDQFRLAEWPQVRWVLAGGAYVLYLLCLWEVETLLLIVPPGRETLALRVFNMLHYGHAGQVDALCVWLIILALAPLLVFSLLARLKRRLAGLGLILLLATGCDTTPKDQVKLKSQLFSGVQVIGSRGTGAGEFNKPRSVGLDRDDNLYVVDLTGRVQKFSPEGRYLLSWQMPETDIGKPKGMVKDEDGNLVLVEPHYSRVNHYQGDGSIASQWGEMGTNQAQLQFPRAVAVNSHGEIYVSEYGLVERIQQFGHHGKPFLRAFGRGGTRPGELNRAEGIGVTPDDLLYVADSCNHRVQVFSRDGKYLRFFGKAGSGPGEMSYPYDVRIDAEGNRFVCEFGNSRIQVFDSSDRTREIIGGPGYEPGRMNNPWAIALDSRGNLYVADSANHRVQKFIRREPLRPGSDPSRMAAR